MTCSSDPTPVPTTARIEDGKLILAYEAEESGCVTLPWPVGAGGAVAVSTSTLRERTEPYHLYPELARGKLNQVRNQLNDWQEIGFQTPDDLERDRDALVRLFGSVATNQPSTAADTTAARVLERSFAFADRLTRLYIEQMFSTRHDEEGALDTRFATWYTELPAGSLANEYRRAFNAARIGLSWRDIEPNESQYNWGVMDRAVAAAQVAGLPVTMGPVIELSPKSLPDWAVGWVGDLPTLAAFMCDYLETCLARYGSQVRRWVVCAGFNTADRFGLRNEERLRLARRLFDAALRLDPDLELVLSLTQPWGEYLARSDYSSGPLAFVDDLVRNRVRISAVELEIRNGTAPRGGWPRDLLDTSQMLENFGVLGPSLEVLLSCPASAKPDSSTREQGEGLWEPAWYGSPTAVGQAEWGASFAALALCNPLVRSVTWDHWSDVDSHLVPNGGLVDASGRPRPILSRFQALRTTHLR